MCAMSPRLLRPVASGFDPRRLSGLQVWFDGNDVSTITTVSGDVSEWKSKVGGLTSTQTTANNRPEYRAAGMNGKGALFFNGTSDALLTNFNANTLTGYVTMAVAVLPESGMTSTSNYPAVLGARLNTSTNLSLRPPNPTVTQYTMNWRNGTFNATAGGQVQTVNQTVLATIDATALTIRVNGVSGTQAGTYTAGSNETNAEFRIGQDGTFARYWHGTIAEVLVWNRSFNTSELVAVERYLARKWGVTL